jgi:hypothetical protein
MALIFFFKLKLQIRDESFDLGNLLSSSSNARRPIGRDRSMSKTGLLSENSTRSTGMPSAMYSWE